MTEIKPKVNSVRGTIWNKDMLNAIGVAKSYVAGDRDIHVELCPKGLAIIKSGMKCGVINGTRMILDIQFESVVVLENGWMVTCKYGIYDLYNEEGEIYKGLSFLKKENAIRFAKTL